MTQKEKARAYDEAVKKVKDYYEGKTKMYSDVDKTLNLLFPELKEDKDEKIRKSIISGLKYLETEFGWDAVGDVDILDAYDWLEKQKVLPAEEDLQGREDVSWCIEQAKKVAKDENEMGTCWFAEKWLEKQGTPYTKRDVDDAYLKGVCDAKQELEKQGQKKCIDDLTQQEAMDIAVAKCFEQGKQKPINDTKQELEKPTTIDIDKMVDDYANNKERGNEEFGKPVNCMIRAYRQGLNDAIGKVVSNPAWSEEDDYMLDSIISDFYGGHKSSIGQDKWLKSLKDRLGGEK